jgi:hypothetical protein
MYGADVEQLEQTARRLAAAAEQLERVRTTVRSGLYSVRWGGADAEHTRRHWDSVDGPILTRAAQELRVGAEALRRNAREQTAASDVDGASAWAGAAFTAGAIGGVGAGLTGGMSHEELNRLVKFLFDTGGGIKDLVNVVDTRNLIVALLGGTEELKGVMHGKFPWLDMALYGGEAAYWIASEGIEDARAWDPMGRALLTGGAAVAGAAILGAPLAAGAAAAGLGFAIGDGINMAFELTTGASLSDHMADAAIGDEIADIEQRSAANEIHRGMSSAEISRRADEANRIAEDAHKLTERTKTPWGCVGLMLGF